MALDYRDIAARQPELSYVPPQNFFMVVSKLPQVVFNLQQVQIPPLSGEEVPLMNPINSNKAYLPGDGVDYSQLDVTFLLDKDFLTYRSILDWLKGINKPDGFQQWNDYVEEAMDDPDFRPEFARSMSDIVVFGTDASGLPLVEWKFKYCFPITLDGPAYDATAPDIEYLTSSASFRYMYFEHSTFTNGVKDNTSI